MTDPIERNGNVRDPRPGEPDFDSLPEAEQRRRAFLASFLAVEHSLEAVETVRHQTRVLEELSGTMREQTRSFEAYANRTDALIDDVRDIKAACSKCEPPPPAAMRPPAQSWSDLDDCKTDGGTHHYLTTDQLDEALARRVEDAMARHHDAKDAAAMRDLRQRRASFAWAVALAVVLNLGGLVVAKLVHLL